MNIPILEPDLYRAFSHVDIAGDTLTGGSGRSGVLVEFNLQRDQLILGSPLALVVLLLLGQSALSSRSPSGASSGSSRDT